MSDESQQPTEWQQRLMDLFTKVKKRKYRCDHCGVEFVEKLRRLELSERSSDPYDVLATKCPSCDSWLVFLVEWEDPSTVPMPTKWRNLIRLWPLNAHVQVAAEVPESFAVDLREAFAVLPVSPKASAALSRRLLQRTLHEKLGIKKKSLAEEIAAFVATKPPSHVAETVDHVRVVGNFAAHPIKSTNTGEVVDVETGEADWLLGTLIALFDFVFVQPARLASQKTALNSKLASAGKPMLK